MMKITSNDPRLTAYAMGELSAAESERVRAALEADAGLRSEFESMQSLMSLLSGSLAGEQLNLGMERRAEIHASGKRPDTGVLVMKYQRRSRWQSFAAVAGVAVMVSFGFYLLSNTRVSGGVGIADMDAGSISVGNTLSNRGASGAVAASSDVKEGAAQRASKDRDGAVISGELRRLTRSTALDVPVVGRADLPAFQRDLEGGRVSQLRVEELVNILNDLQAPSVQLEGVGLHAEFGSCPWSDDLGLLLVVFRDLVADGVSPQIDARLILEHPRVSSVRLVAGVEEEGVVSQWQSVPDGQSVAVLYEIGLNAGEGRFAAIDLTVNEQSAFLPIVDEGGDSSLEFRVAGVLARFGKWTETQDREVLMSLADEARELLERVSDASARYALDLILVTAEKS